MLQLNPPLARIVVGGPGWRGPTGKGVAHLLEPGHIDDDIIWIIDLDEGGQTWCVPNRYVRAPSNITQGRTSGAGGGSNGNGCAQQEAALPPAHGRISDAFAHG